MYAVSAKYRSKMFDSVRKMTFRIRVTLKAGLNYTFDESRIVENSINLSNACVSGSYFELGSVYMGELDFTILNGIIYIPNLYKAKVVYSILVDISDTNEPEYEEIPIGVFTVYETNISGRNVVVTCYDNMKLLDKQIKAPVAQDAYIYDILSKIASECGVELGMTESEVNSFPSTSIITVIGAAPNRSYRDYLMYCAEVMGGFATFNRSGKLVIRRFGVSPVAEFPEDSIINFSTNYYKYSIETIEAVTRSDGVAEDNILVYDNGNENGYKYRIDSNNALMSSWWDTNKLEKQQSIKEIGNSLKSLSYNSMSVKIWLEPALDLGDMVSFNIYNAKYRGIIMSYSMGVYGGQTINSYGIKSDSFVGKSQIERTVDNLVASISASASTSSINTDTV